VQPIAPDRLRDPTRLPGASRTADMAIAAAESRPRLVAILVILVVAIVAIPALVLVALARLQGDRR